jgi:hypothetical protein
MPTSKAAPKVKAKKPPVLIRPLKGLRPPVTVKSPSLNKRQTKKAKKLLDKRWIKPAIFALAFGVVGCYFLITSLAATDTASCTGPCLSIAGASSAADKYWIMGQDGGVFSINVPYYGSVPGSGTHLSNAVGMVSTPNQAGYYIYTTTGAVYAYGNASYKGGSPGANNIVGFALRPQNDGYWMFGRDGGVFAYGAAPYKNSLPGLNVHINNVVGGAPTKSGNGYWMVGSDGGIFALGDAQYLGSMGGKPLAAPIVAMEPTVSGNGYWLVGADGGIFAYGDATFYGSMAGKALGGPIVSIERTPSGKGYWMLGSDGGVFAYGDARYAGRVKSTPLPPPPAPPKPPAPKTSSSGGGSSSGSRSISGGSSGSGRRRSTSSSVSAPASDPCNGNRQCQREVRDESVIRGNNGGVSGVPTTGDKASNNRSGSNPFNLPPLVIFNLPPSVRPPVDACAAGNPICNSNRASNSRNNSTVFNYR